MNRCIVCNGHEYQMGLPKVGPECFQLMDIVFLTGTMEKPVFTQPLQFHAGRCWQVIEMWNTATGDRYALLTWNREGVLTLGEYEEELKPVSKKLTESVREELAAALRS